MSMYDDGMRWLSSIKQGQNNFSRQDAQNQLGQNGANASLFGQQLQNNYGQGTQNIAQDRNYLQALASGQNSVAAEQLRQGMQQGLAAQQSMAAGANPANAAMAARNAAMNMNRLGYGLSGQQAVAGLQERNQAQQALSQLDLGSRQQDLSGALGSQQNSNGAYGAILGQQKTPSLADQALMGGLGVAAMAAMSDRRLKTDVKDADDHANKAMDGLKAYLYRYKDEKYGKGQQFGIMAQALEKSGLGHAVIETSAGKAVDGAKAALSALANTGALHRRLEKLEGKK